MTPLTRRATQLLAVAVLITAAGTAPAQQAATVIPPPLRSNSPAIRTLPQAQANTVPYRDATTSPANRAVNPFAAPGPSPFASLAAYRSSGRGYTFAPPPAAPGAAKAPAANAFVFNPAIVANNLNLRLLAPVPPAPNPPAFNPVFALPPAALTPSYSTSATADNPSPGDADRVNLLPPLGFLPWMW